MDGSKRVFCVWLSLADLAEETWKSAWEPFGRAQDKQLQVCAPNLTGRQCPGGINKL